MIGAPVADTLELRDIQVPPPPDLWPPAPGWWVLFALFGALLALAGWRLFRHLPVRRRRRYILGELERLRRGSAGARLAAEVSALLKRVALERFPPTQVAPLTGAGWLAFLDRTGGGGRFTDGPGKVLADGPYAPDTALDTEALLGLAGDWVRRNA